MRESIVSHLINERLAIRHGNWKLNLCPGRGGWGKPVDANAAKQTNGTKIVVMKANSPPLRE